MKAYGRNHLMHLWAIVQSSRTIRKPNINTDNTPQKSKKAYIATFLFLQNGYEGHECVRERWT